MGEERKGRVEGRAVEHVALVVELAAFGGHDGRGDFHEGFVAAPNEGAVARDGADLGDDALAGSVFVLHVVGPVNDHFVAVDEELLVVVVGAVPQAFILAVAAIGGIGMGRQRLVKKGVFCAFEFGQAELVFGRVKAGGAKPDNGWIWFVAEPKADAAPIARTAGRAATSERRCERVGVCFMDKRRTGLSGAGGFETVVSRSDFEGDSISVRAWRSELANGGDFTDGDSTFQNLARPCGGVRAGGGGGDGM